MTDRGGGPAGDRSGQPVARKRPPASYFHFAWGLGGLGGPEEFTQFAGLFSCRVLAEARATGHSEDRHKLREGEEGSAAAVAQALRRPVRRRPLVRCAALAGMRAWLGPILKPSWSELGSDRRGEIAF